MVTIILVYFFVSLTLSTLVVGFVSVVGELQGYSTPAWVLLMLMVFILGIVAAGVGLASVT